MYCPSCGAEAALELNYCNRCGANLASAIVPSQSVIPVSLTKPAIAIGLTATLLTLGGFSVLIEGAIQLARFFPQGDPIIAMMVLGMTTIMVSDILLIRLLSRIIRSSLEVRPTVQLPKRQDREVPRQLNPRLDPVPSVTEHTTRTFSPAFREPSDPRN